MLPVTGNVDIGYKNSADATNRGDQTRPSEQPRRWMRGAGNAFMLPV